MKISELPDDIVGRIVYYKNYMDANIKQSIVEKVVIERRPYILTADGRTELDAAFLSETDALLYVNNIEIERVKMKILGAASDLKRLRETNKTLRARKIIEQLSGLEK